jgi:hypothetical protein
VVANALSRKNKAALSKPTMWKEQQLAELKEMGVELDINSGGELLAQLWYDQRIRIKYYKLNFVTIRGARLEESGG